ncbi:MAG: hypothetical protein LW865_14430 [Betaproteobacteria bacterium]|jgi:hypothetical protein|nr:hypothetical protein [Betaproteobacteria bacterium]
MFAINRLNGFNAGATGLPVINLTISTDQLAGYNAFTAAGSPAGAVDLRITVNSSIIVSELRALSFAAGSTILITNNGTIRGVGGTGGDGGSISWFGSLAGAQTGGAGTDAIQTNRPTTINNTSGNVWGGGGGGGGGGGATDQTNGALASGGGGGGGAGDGSAGIAGVCDTFSGGVAYPGSSGQRGVPTSGGLGGAASTGSGANSGKGGDGGDYGQVGANGADATLGDTYIGNGSTGGAAGRAVFTNGAGLTWTGGNNGTQVKGTAA